MTSEKENTSEHTVTVGSKNVSRSRQPRRNEQVLKEYVDGDNLENFSNEDASLTRLQAALETTASATYWKRHISLMECVLKASQSMCERGSSSGSLLLEEHAFELLSTSRLLVKDATEQKDTAKKLKLMLVAIHGLRAICPLMTDSKRIEAIMKILYHAITTASDVCLKAKDASACVDATSQCLAAFQALGSLLNGYDIDLEGNKSKSCIAFGWKASSTPSDLFPVPLVKTGKGASGGMSVKQIFKIATQAAISVANALSHLYTSMLRKEKDSLFICDFGSYTSDVMGQTLDKSLKGYTTLTRLIQDVVVPWTCFLSSRDMATVENIEESLIYSKKGFRLLFYAASHIEKFFDKSTSENSNLSPADSLVLRKQAILTFLLGNGGETLSPNMKTALKKYHWEDACSYACKASVAYRQHLLQHNVIGHDQGLGLDSFHREVGSVLDTFAPDSSLFYVEYCAYRSLHASAENPEKDSCEMKECLFGQLGFSYIHDKCWSSAMGVRKSCIDPGQITLLLFFLALSIQDELKSMTDSRQSRPCAGNNTAQDIAGVSELAIPTFRSVFVDSAQLPPYDVQRRCHKMLEALSLNRKVYVILSNDSGVKPSSAQLTALDIAGRILSECIGPLAVSLMRCTENKKQQYWELAIDSHIRGLAAFDRIRDCELLTQTHNCEVISNKTDQVIRKLFALCNSSEQGLIQSEKILEKAAKV